MQRFRLLEMFAPSSSPETAPSRSSPGGNIAAVEALIHPVQLAAFRRMTPLQKLQRVAELYEAGVQLRIAGLRLAHPGWPPERLEREARRSLLYAGT